MKTCFDCKFLAFYDSGYSNWTVLETTVECLKDLNPGLPAEESYSWNRENSNDVGPLGFGAGCTEGSEGEGPRFDVEGDVTNEDFKNDEELYAALLSRDQRE